MGEGKVSSSERDGLTTDFKAKVWRMVASVISIQVKCVLPPKIINCSLKFTKCFPVWWVVIIAKHLAQELYSWVRDLVSSKACALV